MGYTTFTNRSLELRNKMLFNNKKALLKFYILDKMINFKLKMVEIYFIKLVKRGNIKNAIELLTSPVG